MVVIDRRFAQKTILAMIDTYADGFEYDWLISAFVLEGLKKISNGKAKPLPKKKQEIDNDPVSDFLNRYCKDSGEANSKVFTYFDELYQYYFDFYTTKYSGVVMTYICFNKAVKKSSKYSYGRPHASRQNNSYAYYLFFDKDKYDKDITALKTDSKDPKGHFIISGHEGCAVEKHLMEMNSNIDQLVKLLQTK